MGVSHFCLHRYVLLLGIESHCLNLEFLLLLEVLAISVLTLGTSILSEILRMDAQDDLELSDLLESVAEEILS